MRRDSHLYAVILAGGSGTRLWPRSRRNKPKQLLDIVSNKTMIQETVERLGPLVDGNHTIVVVGNIHFEEIDRQLAHVPTENILIEPEGKNTAPAIGLAAIHLKAIDEEAAMLVLPSDHLITDADRFRKIVRAAVAFAQKEDKLVTIGIQPTFPETGYGYIQIGHKIDSVQEENIYKVVAFREKPTKAVAQKFLKTGHYMWNSGMFVWKVSVILEQIKVHLPDLYEGLMKIESAIGKGSEEKTIEKIYPSLKAESIDFGVMEKSSDVALLKGDFGWNDIGSWAAMEQIWPKDKDNNFLDAKVVSIESTGNIIHSTKKLVAVIGLEDIVIIETEDALLVCKKERAPDVRRVVDELKKRGLEDFL
ncbi:MAG: mannose-1-phosphate guanylyltransferase [Candidatus Abyssobacteria bacterium SURF_5]|uniref:mannose-1-phosphate guanylyltransferase n=1 Tax=Abyssobacteria bacterium (strain SURF_5) TaxID=2093360 RepID=A0A3A4N3Y4_ABYX5|nr:MAG: mannose-1-phosphate guanylyltransferase [Candidatus Abyssubacteria bacterium SURF_5]